jgi:NAD(P)-dependent dehydrogenase (short-subunit alcohol dehydrogenase family)
MGDWNEKEGQKLADELGSRVTFRKCDVSKWADVRDLFQAAWEAFGTIHAVLSNAGINTDETLLEHVLSADGELLPPKLKNLEVNLIGTVYVVKCALYYFDKWPKTQCQILLTASAASFLDTPPLHLYCAGKAGVLGLMRSLRTQVIKKNATINVVAPWLTGMS